MDIVYQTEKIALFNKLACHPLQSWEWGEFRKTTGVLVHRFVDYSYKPQVQVYTMTQHKIPSTPYSIGYVPKSNLPSKKFLDFLYNFSRKNNIISVKFEPNVERLKAASYIHNDSLTIENHSLKKAPRPLFTNFTFEIDLTKSEEELLSQMKSKTRYNMRLAQKKGVAVVHDNSDTMFETYLKLQRETTKRQKFYAHNDSYHRRLWSNLKISGIPHILAAKYQKEVIVTWMLFLFNDVLYYPYGGSSDKHRNVMASNLILWEAALWGKKQKAKTFDLWGALGSNPDVKDPFYGFHRFKEGYGGRLVEFIGSYDFVINPLLYTIYTHAEDIRWFILKQLA